MSKIKQLKEPTGEKIYPVVLADACMYNNGNVKDTLTIIEEKLSRLDFSIDCNDDFNNDFLI